MKLPREPRIGFWKPARELLPYVANYHLYAVSPDQPGGTVEAVFFPGSATLRFKLTPESRWQAHLHNEDWQELSAGTLFGPSDRVTWSRTSAGIALGIGFTARGMAQFLVRPAVEFANRILPADECFTFDLDALQRRLSGLVDDEAIAPALNETLTAALQPSSHADAQIGAIETALADEDVRTVAEVAEAVGLSPRTLQRLCPRYFGFGARKLLRRTRFLRSLSAIKQQPRGNRTAAIDERYTDYSHFIRDAHDFLGHSPEDFLRRVNPLELEAMARRRAIIGEAMHGLAQPPRDNGLAD